MTACHTSTLRQRIALLSLCTLLALPAMAHKLTLNQTVPPTGVADKGELMYQNEQFSYQKLEQRTACWKMEKCASSSILQAEPRPKR